MKHYIVVSIALILLTGCSTDNNIKIELDSIASYIEQEPEKALNALQNMGRSILGNKKTKAKHSLLLSIALDKNYIDKTDFSILQPAIDYYEKHGTPEERLKLYYYKGRIYDNAGNQELAMESYVKGLEVGSKTHEYPTIARLLFSKAQIHQDLYDYNKYIESMLSAAKFFELSNNSQSYFSSIINVVNGYTLLRDSIQAMKWLKILESSTDTSNIRYCSELHKTKIAVSSAFCSENETINAIDNYLHKIPHKNVSWLTVAHSFLESGKYKEGLDAIKNYEHYSKTKTARYYAILSKLHEKLGNTTEALVNYKIYIKLSDSIDMDIFRKDTKFIEEKYTLELLNKKEEHKKNIIIICAVSIVLILGTFTLWTIKALKIRELEKNIAEKDKERYKVLYDNLLEEKSSLVETISNNWEIANNARTVINKRLEILNDFLKAHITESSSMHNYAFEEMEKVFENRDIFLNDTKLIFTVNYPKFISKLEKCGLSETEIVYCCLYAMGLKGTHIGKYLGTSNIYNISSSIRKKLGIDEYKTNIDKHIKELMYS